MPPKDYACDCSVARAVWRRKDLFQRVRAARLPFPFSKQSLVSGLRQTDK